MNVKSRIFVCNLLLLVLLIVFLIEEQDALSTDVEIKFVYGEKYESEVYNVAQIFYRKQNEIFSEANSEEAAIKNNEAILEFHNFDFDNDEMRFDPVRSEVTFSIAEVDILYKGKYHRVISGEEFRKYIVEMVNCTYDEDSGKYIATSNDPFFVLDRKFVSDLEELRRTPRYMDAFGRDGSWWFVHGLVFVIGVLFAVLYGGVQNKGTGKKMSVRHGISLLAVDFVLSVGGIATYGERYLEISFGDVPFGQLLYHLHTPLDGAGMTTFYNLLGVFVGIVILSSITVFLGDYILRKHSKNIGYAMGLSVLGIVYLIPALIRFTVHYDFVNYFKYINEKTELYEEYYVDGRDVEFVFPEEKRNLIYIYLESMEVTFADTASGGAMPINYMPELTTLAKENICFSGGEEINGAYVVPGATFTMGALVAQTAGVPINENLVSNDTLNGVWESENNYLPGVWAIGDVLETEGYNQVFMIGSDGKFAGRASYFHGHGEYEVDDYYTAIEDGRIAEDYHVWWGYEDEKLFSYAKEKIIKMAKEDEPFNFTMLTVDTHFSDGYYCDLCRDDYNLQYSNVIACSSRQVEEFVRWAEEQEFYENTTIVLVGDHLTSDSAYIENAGVSAFDRKIYFTMINPAENCEDSSQKRIYTTMDLYPTTLAGMGISIEGDRLGLGVNLFSEIPTLYEELGDELNTELLKNSDYYTEELLYAE